MIALQSFVLQHFRKGLLFIVLAFGQLTVFGQSPCGDTSTVHVNLTKVQLSKKVVCAVYGKALMYFNQIDYLGTTYYGDTVEITPKYFNEARMDNLMKEGKVQVVSRIDNTLQPEIYHHLEQSGSMCFREFFLPDGTRFFSYMEIYGLMDVWKNFSLDSVYLSENNQEVQLPSKPIIQDYAYDDISHDRSDKRVISIKEYLPLRPSTHFVYGNNNGYGELDTNICKSAWIGNQEVFYFAEAYAKYDLHSIDLTLFGPGVYYYQNDSLYGMEADYEEDLFQSKTDLELFGKRTSDPFPVLPATMVPGDHFVSYFSWGNNDITYLGREDVLIEGVLHEDCAKFKVIHSGSDTAYNSYFWLKKGTGMVRWMRSTGRIDELYMTF